MGVTSSAPCINMFGCLEPLNIENEIRGYLDEVIARGKACNNVRRVLLGEEALDVINGIPKKS
tara:strand:+ start:462 stop:650 length:189 start_codon:yes stop_codon:yes gene_type:complete